MSIDMELNQALQTLQAAKDARQTRLEQEQRETQAIADAEAKVRALQRKKAADDFQAGLQRNAVLVGQNREAVERLHASLNQTLDAFRALLAGLPDEVSPTFDAQRQHSERVINGQVQAIASDYSFDHPKTTSEEIRVTLGPQILERAQQFSSAWNLRSTLAVWVRNAADASDYRQRAGLVFALLGEELGFNREVSNEDIQATLNHRLHDHLSGAR